MPTTYSGYIRTPSGGLTWHQGSSTGGSTSGGGSSGGGSSSTTTTTHPTGSYIAGRGFVTSDGKVYPTTNPSWTPSGYTNTGQTSGGVSISSGGGVTTYDSSGRVIQTSIGKAIVPGTNLTANQLYQQTKTSTGSSSYSGYLTPKTNLTIGNVTYANQNLYNAEVLRQQEVYNRLQQNIKDVPVEQTGLGPSSQRYILQKTYFNPDTGKQMSQEDLNTYLKSNGIQTSNGVETGGQKAEYVNIGAKIGSGKPVVLEPFTLEMINNAPGVKQTFIEETMDRVKYSDLNQFLKKNLEWVPAKEIGQSVTETLNVATGLTIGIVDPGVSIRDTLKVQTPVTEFAGGFVGLTLQDIKDNPIQNLALVGLGAGIGAGVGVVAKGVTLIPKVGSLLSTGVKTATVGYGLYTTAEMGINTYQRMGAETDYYKKGGILGITLKDIGLVAWGFNKGTEGYKKIEGYVTTRGRTFLETQQGIYPQAPASKHLELFQKNIIKELGEKPGSFHTTSSKFWKDSKIIPTSGTSELSGFYGSTKVSTSFSRIQGSGATAETNWFKGIKDYLQPSTSPGIAYLKPKGFRNVEIGFSKIKQFEGQKFIKGKGYAYYKTPAKAGFMDVPGIKTEIEAIARTKAGSYSLENAKYYTEIKGVRVSVDTFNYDKIMSDLLRQSDKNIAKKFNQYKNNQIPKINKPITPSKQPSQNVFQEVVGKKPEITWDEISSTGKDMIKKTLKAQSTHEVSMAEISFGKVSSTQKNALIERRYEKLLQETIDRLNSNKPIQHSSYFPENKPISQNNYMKKNMGLLEKNEKELSKKIADFNGVKAYGGQSSYSLSSLSAPYLPFGLKLSSVKSTSLQVSSSSIPSSSILSSSYMKLLSSSMGSSISNLSSGLSSSSRASSSTTSSSSQSSSSKSSSSDTYSGSSGSSYNPLSSPYKLPPLFRNKPRYEGEKKLQGNLGEGYYAYGKIIRTNKFEKLNQTPVTKSRAQDLGAYYVDTTVARTFKVVKANQKAQGDKFPWVPLDYFKSISTKLRGYKIKERLPTDIGQQYIEKNIGIADTKMEQEQLRYFKNLQKKIL